ncbi:MAG TPA: DUF4783 domain-containing protein [Bacteroidales bacterium]|nr:DUF4783 domain-containing protein [Bacteroidales bacterium]
MNLQKITFRFLFLMLAFSAPRINASADVPEGIVAAIKTGNARELAKYFNTTIELVIADKEGIYSKPQAEQILKDFFTKNPLTKDSFRLLHEVGKESSRYAIGNLYTTKGVYRISFLIKTVNNVPLIDQLRIEEDNG